MGKAIIFIYFGIILLNISCEINSKSNEKREKHLKEINTIKKKQVVFCISNTNQMFSQMLKWHGSKIVLGNLTRQSILNNYEYYDTFNYNVESMNLDVKDLKDISEALKQGWLETVKSEKIINHINDIKFNVNKNDDNHIKKIGLCDLQIEFSLVMQEIILDHNIILENDSITIE